MCIQLHKCDLEHFLHTLGVVYLSMIFSIGNKRHHRWVEQSARYEMAIIYAQGKQNEHDHCRNGDISFQYLILECFHHSPLSCILQNMHVEVSTLFFYCGIFSFCTVL